MTAPVDINAVVRDAIRLAQLEGDAQIALHASFFVRRCGKFCTRTLTSVVCPPARSRDISQPGLPVPWAATSGCRQKRRPASSLPPRCRPAADVRATYGLFARWLRRRRGHQTAMWASGDKPLLGNPFSLHIFLINSPETH